MELTGSLFDDSPRRQNILLFLPPPQLYQCLLTHGCGGYHLGSWGDLEGGCQDAETERLVLDPYMTSFWASFVHESIALVFFNATVAFLFPVKCIQIQS